MRSAVVLVAALGVAACDAGLHSSAPLFTASGPGPEPGLWALLDAGCATPRDAAVQTWPECAAPIWVTRDGATILFFKPQRISYALAAGAPAIVQFGVKDPQTGQASFNYMLAEPVGRPPYRRAMLRIIGCPKPDRPAIPGLSAPNQGIGCLASTAEAVRAAAREPPGASSKPLTAVWIAPAQTLEATPR